MIKRCINFVKDKIKDNRLAISLTIKTALTFIASLTVFIAGVIGLTVFMDYALRVYNEGIASLIIGVGLTGIMTVLMVLTIKYSDKYAETTMNNIKSQLEDDKILQEELKNNGETIHDKNLGYRVASLSSYKELDPETKTVLEELMNHGEDDSDPADSEDDEDYDMIQTKQFSKVFMNAVNNNTDDKNVSE